MNAYQAEDNAERTARANHIMTLAHSLLRGDYDDTLADLLADLMHWSDNTGADFHAALARATQNYCEEADQPAPSVTIHISGGAVQDVAKFATAIKVIIDDDDNRRATPPGELYFPDVH